MGGVAPDIVDLIGGSSSDENHGRIPAGRTAGALERQSGTTGNNKFSMHVANDGTMYISNKDRVISIT